MHKKAFITGITGQDGIYLADFLLKKGYEVHGLQRRASWRNSERLEEFLAANPYKENLFLHYGDVTDATNLIALIKKIEPDELYNLAAQSHVHVSFETPEYTAQADALGTLRLLEAVRILGLEKKTKIYQASTSELFGNVPHPQDEQTPFCPQSPYATAKLYAYWITVNYRQAYGMFACNGILFNHESPLRGPTFVTRKISQFFAARACGKWDILYLGNLDARRDWGYAAEYVQAMWLMLQHEVPEDFVIATGISHSVRDCVNAASEAVGITLEWKGSSNEEQAYDTNTGALVVAVDPTYYRPAEVYHLQGNARKAYEKLGWKPRITFRELMQLMVDSDIRAFEKQRYSQQALLYYERQR